MSVLSEFTEHLLAEFPPRIHLALEIAVPLAAALGFILWRQRASGRLEALTNAFRKLALRRGACFALVALFPLAIRLAMLSWWGVPVPYIHDDFAHLLLADTFIHGRLANPPHPMAKHLETIYVIQSPTYSSAYPPGTAFALAAGTWLTGVPWAGIALTASLMCATTYWMLLAWIGPPWALLGGLLTACVFGVTSAWVNTYSGGALAGVGGALVLGALPRLMRRPTVALGAWMGLGIGMIFFIRPYECLSVVLICSVVLLRTFTRLDRAGGIRLLRSCGGAAPVLAGVLLLTLFHNWRVSGNPFEMPYRILQQVQGTPQSFLFQKPVIVPPSDIPEMEDVRRRFLQVRLNVATVPGYVRHVLGMFLLMFTTFVGFHFLPALPGILLSRRREVRLAVMILVIGLLPCFLYGWFYTRYLTHYVCITVFLAVAGLQAMRHATIKGLAVGEAVIVYVGFACAMIALRGPVGSLTGGRGFLLMERTERSEVAQQLLKRPGRHLVFVKFGPEHSYMNQWIANSAEVDTSPIVWARALDPESDRRAVEYWKERDVWDVFADESPPRLVRIK
ncbi:MAG: hypothetical protein ABI759_06815 [Candidatus Solibacter sp.]